MKKLILLSALALALAACQTVPIRQGNTAPKPELQFIDLKSFDQDLASSLSATLPTVQIGFYDDIVPSALPERLQVWMAAVEAGGGKVNVVPPKTEVKTRSLMLIVSAVSALWSASKVMKDVSEKSQFRAAETYDAEILLKADKRGNSVLDKVTFTQRKR